MNDTNKLAELIKKAKSKMWGKTFHSALEKNMFVADYLLANGVVLPPVKIYQKVYVCNCDEAYEWVDEYTVKYFHCNSEGVERIFATMGTSMHVFRPKDIGETVFLTEEEAEEKLKELKDNA